MREQSATTYLVTGGAGFIGSALVRHLLRETAARVVVLDKLGYAGHLASLAEVADDPRFAFEQLDVRDEAAVAAALHHYAPDAVLHLAAETHVDRSIDDPRPFLSSNVEGTFALLEATRRYWRALPEARRRAFRLLHVSTDEVFGALGETGVFTETSRYDPRSPYAASKAASDHLVRAWHHTYGLPVVISNCSNNYGPYQHPEKLIPTVILRAAAGQEIPVYGNGRNVRDWLHVEDHARALRHLVAQGAVGESYTVGARNERSNLALVQAICRILDELSPAGAPHARLITFVADRPGHDFRYAIDPEKLERLGWRAQVGFETGLRQTVAWYLDNPAWCRKVLGDKGGLTRLGLAGA